MTYNLCILLNYIVYCISGKGGTLCQESAPLTLYSPMKKKDSLRQLRENIRHRIVLLLAPKSSSWLPRVLRTKRSQSGLICRARLSPSGENVFFQNVWLVSQNAQGVDARLFFPPEIVVEIKALACQLPKDLGLPFSRLGREQIAEEAIHRGIVASISGATVWRWLHADAIRPWCYRSWIWPRDPRFEEKAGRVLDLYHGTWEGEPLGPDDYVICADEKTSIQARKRVIPTTPPVPGYAGRVEHEYKRRGALAYLAAWDIRQAKVFGLCQAKTGIESFHRLVDLVMKQEPYRSAQRVFWVTDNCSSHRGQPAINRLLQWYQNAILVHTPIHASWLNQVEIYFSVVQRAVLTPNDFQNLQEVEARLISFQKCYEKTAKPFEWKFTRENLRHLLCKLSIAEQQRKAA